MEAPHSKQIQDLEQTSAKGPGVHTEAERVRAQSGLSGPVHVSVPLPLDRINRSRTVWPKLLHAAALPLIVGLAVLSLGNEGATPAFQRAWPVMALLGLAYVGAWVLNSKFEQYPFIDQFEVALLSAGLTLVPAGLVFAMYPGSPANVLALFATGGSIAWYLVEKLLHRYRHSTFLLIPGGAARQLLASTGVSVQNGDGGPWGEVLDGTVVDLHAPLSAHAGRLADHSMKGLPMYHPGYLYELLTARVLLGASCETSLSVPSPAYNPFVKRGMDLLLIALSLPVTLPVAGLTALAIRLESRGPALFWQKRTGRDGEPFQMVKFRSMYVGNEGEEKSVFADEDDDRVTWVGRFLRKARIDELPQFWNVVMGEMSLIGPRPEQVGLADGFTDDMSLYEYRHRVPPGITGWAQVLHGYADDEEGTRRKLEHDLYYVKHQSVTLDLLITYLTLKTILSGFGAR